MTQKAILLLAVLAVLTIYLALPAISALVRQHPERRLIYKLIPLTLLSGLLWLVLITWAYTGQRDDAVVSRWVAKLRGNNRLPLAIALLVLAGAVGSFLTLLR